MSKFLEVEVKDKKYKLQYNRTSIKMMEQLGYNPMTPGDKPYTNFEIAITAGLYMHHSGETTESCQKIASEIADEYGVMEVLITLQELYQDVINFDGAKKKKLVVKNA